MRGVAVIVASVACFAAVLFAFRDRLMRSPVVVIVPDAAASPEAPPLSLVSATPQQPTVSAALQPTVTAAPEPTKYLLSTSITGLNYLPLLAPCLKSLEMSLRSTKAECVVLVITNTSFVHELTQFVAGLSFNSSAMTVRIFSCNETNHYFLRLHTFELPDIYSFRAVLQFDIDVIFVGSLDNLLREITPGKFFVYPEGRHDYILWSLDRYTKPQLEAFKSQGIQSFNSGIIAFRVSPEMLTHLQVILYWASLEVSLNSPHFADQSFLNVYMNTEKIADTRGPISDKYVVIWAKPGIRYRPEQVVLHVIGGGEGSFAQKLSLMTQVLKERHSL
jgi:hypothetical protein